MIASDVGALLLRHALAVRPAAMPAQQPPTAIELEYVRVVTGLVRRAMRVAYEPLLRMLPGLVAGARARRGDALRLDDKTEEAQARREVRRARRRMAQDLSEPTIRGVAGKAASDVERHNHAQLGRQLRSVLGVDPLGADAKKLKPIIDGFIHENVALIQDLTPGLASRIEGTILKALTEGTLHEDLARQLQERAFGYAEQRAELAKLGPDGAAVVRDVSDWMRGLATRGLLSAEEHAALRQVGTAHGVRALAKLRELAGERPIPVTALDDGSATDADARRTLTEGYAKGDEALIARGRSMLAQLDKAGRLRPR